VTNTGTLHRRTNITTHHCNLIRTCPLKIAVAYYIRNVETMIVVCLMNYMNLTHVNHKQLQAVLILLLKLSAHETIQCMEYFQIKFNSG